MAPPRKSAEGVSTPSNKKSGATNEAGEASNSAASKKDSTAKDGGSGKDIAAQGLNIEVSIDADSNFKEPFEIHCDSSCKSSPDLNDFDRISRNVNNDSNIMSTQPCDRPGESFVGSRIPLSIKDDTVVPEPAQDDTLVKRKETLLIKNANINLEDSSKDIDAHTDILRVRKRKPSRSSPLFDVAGYDESAHYAKKLAFGNENLATCRPTHGHYKLTEPRAPTALFKHSGPTAAQKALYRSIGSVVPKSEGFHFNGTYEGGHIYPSVFAKGDDHTPIGPHEMIARTFLKPSFDPPLPHHSELGYLGGGIAVGEPFPSRADVDQCLSLRLIKLDPTRGIHIDPPERTEENEKANQPNTRKLGPAWDGPIKYGPKPAPTPLGGESDCVCLLCTSSENKVKSGANPEAETDVEMDEDRYDFISRWVNEQAVGLPESFLDLSRPTTPENQIGCEPDEPKTPMGRRDVAPLADRSGPKCSGMTDIKALVVAVEEECEDKTAHHM